MALQFVPVTALATHVVTSREPPYTGITRSDPNPLSLTAMGSSAKTPSLIEARSWKLVEPFGALTVTEARPSLSAATLDLLSEASRGAPNRANVIS
jgi:hypothetical protein